MELIELDLSKKYIGINGRENTNKHPDIKLSKTQYLVKIKDKFFAGRFFEVWFGLSFSGWYGGTLQYDKPGTNSSNWQGIWEIVE